MTQTITVIRGDGIGPEIMDATLHVLDAMDLGLQYEFADAGLVGARKARRTAAGRDHGLDPQHRVALKSPLTTPVGEGFSLDQRRAAQALRPVRQRAPGEVVPEHQVALPERRRPDHGAREHRGRVHRRRPVAVGGRRDRACSRRRSRAAVPSASCATPSSWRASTGRKKVTVVHKANILKSTSGLFLKVAREVAAQYPDIECNEMIVDNCCMQLVMKPEQFDIIVTTNLFGDIISDLCAGLVGGLGLAPGANIGTDAAIFEAVHGSAPDIAGKGIANPVRAAAGRGADARPPRPAGRGDAPARGDRRHAAKRRIRSRRTSAAAATRCRSRRRSPRGCSGLGSASLDIEKGRHRRPSSFGCVPRMRLSCATAASTAGAGFPGTATPA